MLCYLMLTLYLHVGSLNNVKFLRLFIIKEEKTDTSRNRV